VIEKITIIIMTDSGAPEIIDSTEKHLYPFYMPVEKLAAAHRGYKFGAINWEVDGTPYLANRMYVPESQIERELCEAASNLQDARMKIEYIQRFHKDSSFCENHKEWEAKPCKRRMLKNQVEPCLERYEEEF